MRKKDGMLRKVVSDKELERIVHRWLHGNVPLFQIAKDYVENTKPKLSSARRALINRIVERYDDFGLDRDFILKADKEKSEAWKLKGTREEVANGKTFQEWAEIYMSDRGKGIPVGLWTTYAMGNATLKLRFSTFLKRWRKEKRISDERWKELCAERYMDTKLVVSNRSTLGKVSRMADEIGRRLLLEFKPDFEQTAKETGKPLRLVMGKRPDENTDYLEVGNLLDNIIEEMSDDYSDLTDLPPLTLFQQAMARMERAFRKECAKIDKSLGLTFVQVNPLAWKANFSQPL